MPPRAALPQITLAQLGSVLALGAAVVGCNMLSGADDVTIVSRGEVGGAGAGASSTGGADAGHTGGNPVAQGGNGASAGQPGTAGQGAGNGCGTDGTDANGVCSSACGAAPACDGRAPGSELGSCQAAGNPAVEDRCDASCQVGDLPGSTCRAVGVYDCQGDPNCDGVVVGTGNCNGHCAYDDPTCSSTSGNIRVLLNGAELFNYPTAKSLTCLNLHYTTDQYGSGPPAAPIIVTQQQSGLLEADLVVLIPHVMPPNSASGRRAVDAVFSRYW